MDYRAADEGHETHRHVPLVLRRSPVILTRTPEHLIFHQGRWLEEDRSPPRDYREMTDIGGCRAWHRDLPVPCMPSRREALEHAEDVAGYQVDWEHARTGRVFAHEEAWNAARELLLRNSSCLWIGRVHPNFRESQRIRAVFPNFIVPDQNNGAHLVPLFLIVEDLDRKATRWIAIEVDNEKQSDALRAHLLRFDAHLEAELGIEVYRVAAWWLRVNPFRVIAEVLRSIGAMPTGYELKGEHLTTIAAYVCASCDQPMIRRDVHSIDVVERYGELVAVHAECATDVLDAAC